MCFIRSTPFVWLRHRRCLSDAALFPTDAEATTGSTLAREKSSTITTSTVMRCVMPQGIRSRHARKAEIQRLG